MESSHATTRKLRGRANEPSASNVAFYRFANQYGLLKMGNDRSLDNFIQALKRVPLKAKVQIYAFTDPNDLLSYPLNLHANVLSTCNVYVRNPAFTFGILMEPLDAHLNYKSNPAVLKTMLNGPDSVIVAGKPVSP